MKYLDEPITADNKTNCDVKNPDEERAMEKISDVEVEHHSHQDDLGDYSQGELSNSKGIFCFIFVLTVLKQIFI